MAETSVAVAVSTPSGANNSFPVDVQRSFTVSGTISWSAPGWRLFSMSVDVKVGANIATTPASISGGNSPRTWTCTVQADIAVVPGSTLTVHVSGGAIFTATDGEGHTDTDRPSASIDFLVRLPARIAPNITINNLPATLNTAQLPFTFTVQGSASGVQAAVQTVQYKVEGGQFANAVNPSGNWSSWSTTVPLPPGTHTITARATDGYGTVGETSKSITVTPTPPIIVPPGARTTLAGVPTTSSITSWMRLEPQCTQTDMNTSTSARVFDPLWMLARQWQMGEFQGEDAGTPVLARARATSAKLTRSRAGELPKPPNANPLPVAGAAYDPARTPLEVIVERRKMRAANETDPRMLRFAVEAGLHFLRLLEQQALSKNYRAAVVAKLALKRLPDDVGVDDATARYLQSMAGRAPDGRILASLLRSIGAAQVVTDPALGIVTADRPKAQQAATNWLTWYDSVYSEPASASDEAWNLQRFEYSMAVGARLSATEDVTFAATEIDGSPLEWSSFDVHPQISLTTAPDQSLTSLVEVTIPAPVTFPGSPAPRFWEVEDAKVAYGLVPVGPTDIGHLLMIEYASSFGNDWFIVPLMLPVGSVTRVDSLVVTDTFGVRNLVRPMGDPGLPAPYFSLWQSAYLYPKDNSTPKILANRFFLPPTLPRTFDGPPLEDVLLMRDEMANVAWAIERSIESPIEQPARLYETTEADDAAASSRAPGGDLPRYVLSSQVPSNWIPLLPIQLPNPQAATIAGQVITRLKRGAVLQPDGSRIVHSAASDLLKSSTDGLFYDEEVPREGTHITRRRRMTRWTDGSTWVWTSLRNETGLGEGSGGLQFDQAVEKSTAVGTANG